MMKVECFGLFLCCSLLAAFPGDEYSVKELTSSNHLNSFVDEQNPISNTYVTSTSDNKNNEDETSGILKILKKYQKTNVKNTKENDFNLPNEQSVITNHKGNKTTKVYKITITKISGDSKQQQTSNDNHERTHSNEVKVLPVDDEPKDITNDATEQKYTEETHGNYGKTENYLHDEHLSTQMDVAQGGIELSKETPKLTNSEKLSDESAQTTSPQSKTDSVFVNTNLGLNNSYSGHDRSSYVRSNDDSDSSFSKKSQDKQIYFNLRNNKKVQEFTEDQQKPSSFDISNLPLLEELDDYSTKTISLETWKQFVAIIKLLHLLNLLPDITNISKTLKSDMDYINTAAPRFPKSLLQIMDNPYLGNSVEVLKSILSSEHAFENKNLKVFLTLLENIQENVNKIGQPPKKSLNSNNKTVFTDSYKLFVKLLELLNDLPTKKSESDSQKLFGESETILKSYYGLPQQLPAQIENHQSFESSDTKNHAPYIINPMRNFKKIQRQNDNSDLKSEATLKSILTNLLHTTFKDHALNVSQENRPSEVLQNLEIQSITPVQIRNKVSTYPQNIVELNDVNTLSLAKDTINKPDLSMLQKLIHDLNVVANNKKWDSSTQNWNYLPFKGFSVNPIEKLKRPKFDKSIVFTKNHFALEPTNNQIDNYGPERRKEVVVRSGMTGNMLSQVLSQAPKQMLNKLGINDKDMFLRKLSDVKEKTSNDSLLNFHLKPKFSLLKMFANTAPFFGAGINLLDIAKEITSFIESLLTGFTEKSLSTCQQEANADFLLNMLFNITSYLLIDNCIDVPDTIMNNDL